MTTMTRSQYAEHAGVALKTIGRWIKAGKYIVLDDDLIDVEASDANRFQYRDASDPRIHNAKSKKSSVPKPDKDVSEINERAQAIYDGLISGETAIRPIEQSRAMKEHYLAELARLEHLQKDEQLIEMAVAEGVLFDCFRAQRDSWLNWPSRVAPLMAADLGVPADRMTEVLVEYVHNHITSLGEPEFNADEA
ncbi:Uncharacterised protein [Serratia proteamaculans]|uniref:hypothetical protein n=1 Tax=Serratia proteamaculans TaxID=28151 RepID=UPI001021BAAB|nr:hypothetical protein [Serratia proteamaculans]RYM47636.1 hypothetical protein BSQ97_24445 [Serratia proteamaculans]CAI1576936.1 Uncharacterised protein [Serratia proteamaculans]